MLTTPTTTPSACSIDGAEPSLARGTTAEPLVHATIGDAFDRTVRRYPDHDALIVAHQNIRLTYRQLGEHVDALARGLLAYGIAPGDRVGMWSPNHAEWVELQFATAKVGAILVNVNPAYRVDELRYALQQSGCRMLVAATSFKSSDYRAMIDKVRPGLPDLERVVYLSTPDWDELLAAGARVFPEELVGRSASLRPEDAINIQYTSGTTGDPKGATLSHHNIVNNAHFTGRALGYGPDDRACIPVPFYHCFGMVLGTLACVVHGAAMVVPAPTFDAFATLTAIENERCTSVLGVPTMFIDMLGHPELSQLRLESLRTGIMGGAPCPEPVMRACIERMHLDEVTIAYGMTETSPVSTQTDRHDSIASRVGTVGRVHPHVEIKLVDPDTGRTVGRGESGELCTRGYSVMLGYWDDPVRTAEAVDADGWMHTGDLATMNDLGEVQIVGRSKDTIIRGGENISPREVEELLHTMPQVLDVQVVGVPDERVGEELVAWIRPRPGQTVGCDEVRAFCRDKIAHFKIPRYVELTDAFPMTVTGKVQKFRMRELSAERVGATAKSVGRGSSRQ